MFISVIINTRNNVISLIHGRRCLIPFTGNSTLLDWFSRISHLFNLLQKYYIECSFVPLGFYGAFKRNV